MKIVQRGSSRNWTVLNVLLVLKRGACIESRSRVEEIFNIPILDRIAPTQRPFQQSLEEAETFQVKGMLN